eukprot:m.874472 g.874472  ORF g.874472 m.874472 type:complete len:704 (-) comp59800_c0_seq1:102-2213(-)
MAEEPTQVVATATSLYAFTASTSDQLSLDVGGTVEVLSMADPAWWLGQSAGKMGYFPASYVKVSTAEDSQSARRSKQPSESETDIVDILAADAPSTIHNKLPTLDERSTGDHSDPQAGKATVPALPTTVVPPLSALQKAASDPSNEDALNPFLDHSPAVADTASESSAVVIGVHSPDKRHSEADALTGAHADAVSVASSSRPSAVDTHSASHSPVHVDLDESNAAFALGSEFENPQFSRNPTQETGESVADSEDSSSDLCDLARVLQTYHAVNSNQLNLRVGEIIEVSHSGDELWWGGASQSAVGWFPSTYVQLLDPVEYPAARMTLRSLQSLEDQPVAADTVKLHHVIEEIKQTEESYSGDFKMVIEGYIKLARPVVGQLFDDDVLDVIFGNVEQIASHQHTFKRKLEQCTTAPEIAKCFSENCESFSIYSSYFNNYPRAIQVLSELEGSDVQVRMFFDSCRLLAAPENTLTLPLSGYLIKPVSRLLKYPLLLKELMKSVGEASPDYPTMQAAQEAMTTLAVELNTKKLKMEDIIALEGKLEGWVGPPLSRLTSELLFEGALTKISGSHAQPRHIYLFANVLVYCKKTLKGNMEVRGQIMTDQLTVINLDDGEVKFGKDSLVHAFRISNDAKSKWYILQAKSAAEKVAWLTAFLKERQRVAEDMRLGLLQTGALLFSQPKPVLKPKPKAGVMPNVPLKKPRK